MNDKPESSDGADVRLHVLTLIERVGLADTIGARMRIAREWSGLTMGQVARLRCCSVPDVSDLERGQSDPEAWGWVSWCADYYGVSVRWLRTGVLRVHEDPPMGIPDSALLLLGAM